VRARFRPGDELGGSFQGIVAHWPVSSFFVLGIFLGIDLIFIGSGWITIGLALKKHS